MIVSKNVRIGNSVIAHADSILESVQNGKKQGFGIWYAVTTAWEEENLMYILSNIELRHTFYQEHSLRLLGIAGSRNEALQIVLDLVQSGYNKKQIYEMKQYLEEF